jgi:hypothetical protein
MKKKIPKLREIKFFPKPTKKPHEPTTEYCYCKECEKAFNDCKVCGRKGGHIMPFTETEVRDGMCEYWYQRGKDEIISLIYSMILNKEVDDVEASKIINKIREKIH